MADTSSTTFTVMTAAGLNLIAQIGATKNVSIKSFRAVGSDKSYYDSPEEAEALTDLTPVRQDGIIQGTQKVADKQSQIQIDFDLSKLDADYQLASVGLFATDQDGNEILYAVECLKSPQPMDVSTTGDTSSHFMTIIVDNADNISAQLSNAGTVSMAQYNADKANLLTTDKLKKYLEENNYADKTYVDTTIGQLPSQTISDTRDVDWTPKRYMDNGVKITREFKSNKTLNLDDGGFGDTGFSELITDTPWGNSSGGFPFQIAKDTSNSKFFFRIGKSDDEWGAWTSLIPDLPSGLVSLSDDNTTVTATTKDGEQTGVFVNRETLDKFADKTEVIKKSPDTGEVTEQVNFGATNPINHAGDMYLGAHQSVDEDTAVAAAKAATMPGFFWFPEK
ncbi:hypothetical protein [Secundilactobacillus kimchicus]|uniref:hypothetical protein n=1 Tax=Secundilactobacillus kimchicus TaxID=528209 RepID=UPI0024A7C502|nr:hypothetical protein [Secundilactobacillus kimchicus]